MFWLITMAVASKTFSIREMLSSALEKETADFLEARCPRWVRPSGGQKAHRKLKWDRLTKENVTTQLFVEIYSFSLWWGQRDVWVPVQVLSNPTSTQLDWDLGNLETRSKPWALCHVLWTISGWYCCCVGGFLPLGALAMWGCTVSSAVRFKWSYPAAHCIVMRLPLTSPISGFHIVIDGCL